MLFFIPFTVFANCEEGLSLYKKKWLDKKNLPVIQVGKRKMELMDCLGAGGSGAVFSIKGVPNKTIKIFYNKNEEEIAILQKADSIFSSIGIPIPKTYETSNNKSKYTYIIKEKLVNSGDYYCDRKIPFPNFKNLKSLLSKIRDYNLKNIGELGLKDFKPDNFMHDNKNTWYFIDPLMIKITNEIHADPFKDQISGWPDCLK